MEPGFLRIHSARIHLLHSGAVAAAQGQSEDVKKCETKGRVICG